MRNTQQTNIIDEPIKKDKPFKAWHVIVLSAIAAVLIFALHFTMLYLCNVWPFGTRVPSQYDLLAQIVPFSEHFFDVLSGEGSLFYSYRVAGGMDIFGTVAYCLVSPFSFIFWIFGEGNAWQAAAVMVPCKLVCIAVSAIIMIKMCFPQMKKPVAFVIAILYAYCGYVFVSNTYINWMDFLIYLPFAVPAFNRMVKKGKILPFVIVIALCIYTCFSIACFSMFISYPALVVYGFMVVEKGERKSYLTKLSLAYMCGVIAALPILVPSLIVYTSSGRNTGIFDSLWDDISEISYARKFSYILSDCVFLILIVIYFIKTRFKTKISRYALVSGILVMMPVIVDECCILMNMGSYMSYALRFGFLNALYELVVSCAVMEKFTFKVKPLRAGRKLTSSPVSDGGAEPYGNKKGGNVTAENVTGSKVVAYNNVPGRKQVEHPRIMELVQNYTLPAVAVAAFALLVFFGILGIYQLSESDSFSTYASSFAHSTGAMELMAAMIAIIGITFIIAVALYLCKIIKPNIIFVIMALLLFAQVVMYDGILVSGNVYNHVRYDQYNTLFAEVMENEELEPYEFRVKDYGNYICDNQGLFTNSASYSVFSSSTDSDNFAFNTVFGMGGNSVNTIKSTGGNLLGNCLIGNKYYFYNSEGGDAVRPTLSFDFLEEVGRDTYFIMYENTLVYPSAFTVSSGDLDVVTDYDEYFDNMQNIYTFLGGDGDVFTEYEFTSRNVVETSATYNGEEITVFQVRFYRPDAGDYTIAPNFPDNMEVYWYSGSYSPDNLNDMSGVKTFTYSNALSSTYYYVYFVGTNLDTGESITKEDIIENCSYKAITRDTVEELGNSLWERQVKYTMSSTTLKTSMTASVTTDSEGQYLFINYVALDGHTAYVNGKKVDMVSNGLNMMVIPLEEGENEVVIEYFSPYIYYGAAGVGAAVVLLTLIAVFFCGKKGKLHFEKVKTVAAWASVALAAVVVAFFMVFPTVVFVIKIVKLLL